MAETQVAAARTHAIELSVNGQAHAAEVEPRMLLVHVLRGELGLTGTHIGCDTIQSSTRTELSQFRLCVTSNQMSGVLSDSQSIMSCRLSRLSSWSSSKVGSGMARVLHVSRPPCPANIKIRFKSGIGSGPRVSSAVPFIAERSG